MAHRIPETRKGKRENGNRKWEIRNEKRETRSGKPEPGIWKAEYRKFGNGNLNVQINNPQMPCRRCRVESGQSKIGVVEGRKWKVGNTKRETWNGKWESGNGNKQQAAGNKKYTNPDIGSRQYQMGIRRFVFGHNRNTVRCLIYETGKCFQEPGPEKPGTG